MKFVRYQPTDPSTDAPANGVLEDDGTIRQVIGTPFTSFRVGDAIGRIPDIRLLAPVAAPSKVIGVGLNYIGHIRERGDKQPEIPMLFVKPSTSIVGPGDVIVYPRGSEEVHYEGELAVVIGKEARRVPTENALDYVLGYTCANDVSERAIQRREMAMGAMLIAKGFDTFCPLGPTIATDLDPSDLTLETRLNGVVKQRSSTSDLLFSVPYLISYISAAMTLLPGDLILTGTPAGVGPIAPGDVVEIEISGIGVLKNPVVAES